MRIITPQNNIFDTQVDTTKIFVPMKHHFTLHNYSDKKGKSHIYLHVTQKGVRERIALELYAECNFWDAKKERIKDSSNESQDLNLILDNIESKITSIKTYYRLAEKLLTIEAFMEEFKNGVPRIDFLTFFSYELDKELGNKHANTIKKQKSVLKALRGFKSKILFGEIDRGLIDKFETYRKRQGMKKTTINSNLAIIKKFLKKAQDAGIKMPITISQIKIGSTNGNRDSLTDIELNKMRGYFESSYLRDNYKVPLALFLFSCFTGLRISDAQEIDDNTIDNGNLSFEAIKTGKFQKIRLNNSAKNIIALCPEIFSEKHSDQHINRKLKDICELLGIKKKVTFHYARHTFATNFLRQGGKVEVLQKLLNHGDIKETMIYVHILQEQQDSEIMLLDNIPIIKDSPFEL
jgi:site-specific recombinase XerD